MAAILVMWQKTFVFTFILPSHGGSTWNLASVSLAVSKEKKFENVWIWMTFDQGQWMTLTFDFHIGSWNHLVKSIYQLWYHRLQYTDGRNTFKFGLETTLSIQESSKVNLVQSLSNQWKVLDTVTVKCLWSVSQPHLESVTGAFKITIATCTFLICNRLHKNV